MRISDWSSDVCSSDLVPVKVLVGDEATLSETSTAANFHQLKMTPAEECRAFQYFIGLNNDIDGVAKRFGLTRRFVEGRLRLATLAEPIFEALSAGTITLDVAKAYAQIVRASVRARVCHDVYISVGGVSLKQKK